MAGGFADGFGTSVDQVRKKEFQLSKDELDGETQFTHDERVTPEKAPVGDSKESPSNLLPNIKSFNIDRSKYQHYGHKSSMNAQSLEKIIHEENSRPQTKRLTPIHQYQPPSQVATDSEGEGGIIKSQSDPALNRTIIDETLGHILGLPIGNTQASWPYSDSTLSELLRFKTEQERTKQEEMRSQFASTAVQLLTLAKSMNINSDFIPQLLSSTSLSEMQKNIEFLKATPLTQAKQDGIKRRHSETVKSAGVEAHDHLRPRSQVVSPVSRSPVESPSSVHRRNRSDESEQVAPSGAQSPISTSAMATRSEQHSPNQVAQSLPPPGMYPVYYAPGPPPPPPPSQPNSQPGKEGQGLGSPYKQKYQHIVYQPQPPSQLPSSYPGPGAPYYPAQPYHYYIASPPNQPSNQGQYSSSMAPTMGHPPHIPPPPETKEDEFPSPSYKKQKTVGTGKNNNINFMISTPKNPPARKYNNPKEK
ncbi:hypothetical protein PSN45_001565 [Yamadazyma tenuis]|uniref:uncharacterized protein n=1 Tax=Candida tenuis TaxID=2315449 RepID=UPI0027A6C333|nr:hypothetical protein PSN45_001565 [Yamadazyma tenuis]